MAGGTEPHGSRAPFRLGRWRVDPVDGTLTDDRGMTVRLEPRTFAVLEVLAESPGVPVPREQLLERVWEGAFVEEGAVSRSVAAIRKALGDDARAPSYVETIPKRGYRLIAPVEPETRGSGARRSRRGWVLAAAMAVVVVAAAAGSLLRHRTAIPETPDPPVVAVLPFVNLGPAEHAYFAAGLTEEITGRLAAVRGLGVISRTSANRYGGGNLSLPEIGARLGADYVLEGAVRWQTAKEGEPPRVRISPQLVRTVDDTHLWSDLFDRPLEDLFAVQTEIASEVVRRIDAGLSGGLPEPDFPVPAAYDAYLRGRDLLDDNDLAALANFEIATERDPSFALAWAEQSLIHSSLHRSGYDRAPERCASAYRTAGAAEALLPRHPRVRLAGGYYLYRCAGDYAAALAEFEAAAEVAPGDTAVVRAMASVHLRRGGFERALELYRDAARLDPGSAPVHFDLGRTLATLRRYEEADAALDRAVELEPAFYLAQLARAFLPLLATGDLAESRRRAGRLPADRFLAGHLAYLARDAEAALENFDDLDWEVVRRENFVQSRELWLGFSLRLAGREQEALAAFERARGLLEKEAAERPDDPRIPGELGLAFASLGRRDEALAAGRRAMSLLPVEADALDGPAYLVDMARIHALLGEPEPALELLARALEMPAGRWISVPRVEADPRFDAVRGHPGYRRLIRGPARREAPPQPRGR